jgi:cysteine desulfurase
MSVTLPIYLDNNATTRTDPRVVDAIIPFFSNAYGNAASKSHPFGWVAEEAVDKARAQVASLIGADPREIVFTSGATEAANLALKGVAEAAEERCERRRGLVTLATEHRAVLDPLAWLARRGFPVNVLPVGRDGLVDLDQLADVVGPDTLLVSVMAANNEIGVLQPLAAIGALCRERGALFHCDGAQAVGHIPLAMEELGIDLLGLSGHKLYGPKGVGALVRRPGVALAPQQHGGGQEGGLRAGTVPVPLIVGLQSNGKLSQEGAYAEIRKLWKSLRSSKNNLLSEDGSPGETASR